MSTQSLRVGQLNPLWFVQKAAVACLCTLAVCATRDATAASVAFDSAADPAYAAGWHNDSNGGFGWGSPWHFAQSLAGSSSFLLGSSTTNGGGDVNADGDINTPRDGSGRAWGLVAAPTSGPHGETTSYAYATRLLQGALSDGQTFSIDMDNGFLANPIDSDGISYPGVVGWGISGLDPTGGAFAFGVEAVAGRGGLSPAAGYLVSVGGGSAFLTQIPLTSEGLHCELTFSGLNQPRYTCTLKVTPLVQGSQSYVFTGSGLNTRFSPNDQLVVSDVGGGLDPTEAVYFNNITVGIPEPALVGFMAVGTAAILRRTRRIGKGILATGRGGCR